MKKNFFLIFLSCFCTVSFHKAHAGQNEQTSPIMLNLLYSGEEWDNLSGGIKHATAAIHNFDASLAVDGEKEFGWNGATFLLDGFYNTGKTINRTVGAAEYPSSLDTNGTEMLRLYQAWYNQDLWDGKTSLLVGLYDLNTEFDMFDSASLFFNSGDGFSATFDQTGINGPSSYPDTALGIRARQTVTDTLTLQAAVLDGIADNPVHPTQTTIDLNNKNGALIVGEADYKPDDATKFMAGYWGYTAKFKDLTPDPNATLPTDSNNRGAYLGIGRRLYSRGEDKALNGFLRFGFANGRINEFDHSINAGLTYNGLLPTRPKDQLGFSVDYAHNSPLYQQSQFLADKKADGAETNFELTYRTPITSWLTFQPDVQYTISPSGAPILKNDFLVGIRFEIGHGFSL